MHPFIALRRRLVHFSERGRLRAFVSFFWRRFKADDCFKSAGALAYTTVFSLVPLTAAIFGVVAAFPVFQDWLDRATGFVFANFVPAAARVVQDYILKFAAAARGMTAAGAIGLLVTSLLMMAGVEDTFNRIWRVKTPRPHLARFLVYWTVLTLGPILVLAALALSSYFTSLPLLNRTVHDLGVGDWLFRLVPTAIELCAFTLAYAIVPHRQVLFRHALAGGILATLLFELLKFGFTIYLAQVPSYRQIYGALAAIPIFLLWLYLSWTVVLLGASFAATLAAFRYQSESERLPSGYEFYGLLRLLGRLAIAHWQGYALPVKELRALEPGLSDDLLQRLLGDLCRIGLVQLTEEGCWLLAKDLGSVSIGEVYEQSGFRIPLVPLPISAIHDELGQQVQTALQTLREGLHQPAKQTLDTIYRKFDKTTARNQP